MQSEFIEVQCTAQFLDRFTVRNSIVRALEDALPLMNGTILDVGCGRMPYRELLLSAPSRATKYIGLDLAREEYATTPDLVWDGEHILLSDNAVECALATEVFEHCPEPERIMQEICRVLKPGGLLFFTTPFLWPLHEVPGDEWRYTPFSLTRLLRNSGFSQIRLKPLGGWDASLAQMLGLWTMRRPMSRRKRAIFARLAVPVVRYLYRRDQPMVNFRENSMITGLSGVALKN